MTIGSVICVLALSANTGFADFPRLCRAIAAAIFISLLESYAAIWLDPSQAVIVSFVALILTLLFRPTGLFVATPK